VKLEQRDDCGCTPLLDAAFRDCDPAQIKALLAAGADPRAVDNNGRTALHLVAINRQIEAGVELFIDAGLDVNSRDAGGRTPLMLADIMCHADHVRALLQRGADVDARCDYGGTALHWVARNVLLEGLHPAPDALAYHLHATTEAVRLMVAAGADVAAADHFGLTPFAAAVATSNALACLGMLASGDWDGIADWHLHVPGGLLVHMQAVMAGQVDYLEQLVDEREQQAEEAEEMLEGATGNLRALILGAAGEVARLRGERQPGQQPPSPTQQQEKRRSSRLAVKGGRQQQSGGGGVGGERHGSGSGTELERRWEELRQRERTLEERERELNLRMRVD